MFARVQHGISVIDIAGAYQRIGTYSQRLESYVQLVPKTSKPEVGGHHRKNAGVASAPESPSEPKSSHGGAVVEGLRRLARFAVDITWGLLRMPGARCWFSCATPFFTVDSQCLRNLSGHG